MQKKIFFSDFLLVVWFYIQKSLKYVKSTKRKDLDRN